MVYVRAAGAHGHGPSGAPALLVRHLRATACTLPYAYAALRRSLVRARAFTPAATARGGRPKRGGRTRTSTVALAIACRLRGNGGTIGTQGAAPALEAGPAVAVCLVLPCLLRPKQSSFACKFCIKINQTVDVQLALICPLARHIEWSRTHSKKIENSNKFS